MANKKTDSQFVGLLIGGATALLAVLSMGTYVSMQKRSQDLSSAASGEECRDLFAGQGEFNLMVFNDAWHQSADVEGKVAVGNNARFKNYSIGDRLTPIEGERDSLIVGNNLDFQQGQVNKGNVVYGGNLRWLNAGVPDGQLLQGYRLDFQDIKSRTIINSNELATTPINGTTVITGQSITFTGTDSGYNYFEVSGEALSSATSLNFDTPDASVAIVTVTGSAATMVGGMNTGGMAQELILFNMPEVETLRVGSPEQGISLLGSILAPKATLYLQNGNIEGNVVINNLYGVQGVLAGEFHNKLFQGCIPPENLTASPTPTPNTNLTCEPITFEEEVLADVPEGGAVNTQYTGVQFSLYNRNGSGKLVHRGNPGYAFGNYGSNQQDTLEQQYTESNGSRYLVDRKRLNGGDASSQGGVVIDFTDDEFRSRRVTFEILDADRDEPYIINAYDQNGELVSQQRLQFQGLNPLTDGTPYLVELISESEVIYKVEVITLPTTQGTGWALDNVNSCYPDEPVPTPSPTPTPLSCEVVTFEVGQVGVSVEGSQISEQVPGVKFSLKNGGSPKLVKTGSPRFAFQTKGASVFDTLNTNYQARHGKAFLVDRERSSETNNSGVTPIVIEFTDEAYLSNRVSLDLLDPDIGESFYINAYDDSGNLVDQVNWVGKEVDSGRSVNIQLVSDGPNITSVEIGSNSRSGFGWAMDNINACYDEPVTSPEPTPTIEPSPSPLVTPSPEPLSCVDVDFERVRVAEGARVKSYDLTNRGYAELNMFLTDWDGENQGEPRFVIAGQPEYAFTRNDTVLSQFTNQVGSRFITDANPDLRGHPAGPNHSFKLNVRIVDPNQRTDRISFDYLDFDNSERVTSQFLIAGAGAVTITNTAPAGNNVQRVRNISYIDPQGRKVTGFNINVNNNFTNQPTNRPDWAIDNIYNCLE